MRDFIQRLGSFLLGGGIALLITTPLFLLFNAQWVLFTVPTGALSSIAGFLMGGLEYRDREP